MKSTIFLALLILWASIHANAQQVSQIEAERVALEFFGNQTTNDTPRHLKAARSKSLSTDSDYQPYYVFTSEASKGGFVIIAGDKRLNKILGYSDTSEIDLDNLPPQLSTLLDKLPMMIKHIPTSTPEHKSWSEAARTSTESTVLETALWGQNAPYNGMCPEIDGQKCVTGCVATAIAIVMKYHNWPPKGRGKHTLPCSTGFIGANEVDFDFETDFDFDNMLCEYVSDSPQDNCDAVAKLMLAAGAASHMSYGLGVSGASTTFVPASMIYNLRYSPELTHISCNDAYVDPSTLEYSYTREEMNAIIREQIEVDGQPVLGSTYNHLMIIDGVDANGLFHINWGWDGLSNGFFDINNMTINGNVLSAIINIKPDKSNINISEAHLRDNDLAQTSNFQTLDWFYPWLNISTNNVCNGEKFDAVSGFIYFPQKYYGEYGLAIVDEDYNIVEILKTSEIDCREFPTPDCKHIAFTDLTPTVEIKPTYKIQIVTKATEEQDWAIVPSTRQVTSWAPCIGYEPKTIKLNYSTIGDISINAYAVGDGNMIYNVEPPTSILNGMPLTLNFSMDYNIWAIDDYDYRIALGINGKARDNVLGSTTRYYFNDDKTDIVLSLTPVSELKSAEISLCNGERIDDKITPEEALKIRSLTVSGTIDESDFKFIDEAFPQLEYLDLSSTIAENGVIPPCFLQSSKTLNSIILPSDIKTISRKAFTSAPLDYITIPASVERIGYESFGRNDVLKEVWIERPLYDVNEIDGASFWECSNIKESILHVPANEIESCKEHYVWSRFGSILAFVPGEVEKLALYDSKSEMEVGETHSIKARILPDYVENNGIIFETSDNNVIFVDNEGRITAKKAGQATITARSVQKPDIATSYEITVKQLSGIESSATISSDNFNIYNINGILVKSNCTDTSDNGLTPGVYIIRKGDKTEKFVVR